MSNRRTTPAGYNLERLHVEVSGPEEAQPLMILHGWGSSAQLMQPVAKALAGERRIYNVDLPGHGMSPPPPTPWGIPEHAALVHALKREHAGEQPLVLLGHSNGGRLSLYMAGDERYRSDIKALVLVSPSGVHRERTAAYYLRRAAARTLKAPIEQLPEGQMRDFMMDWLRHSLVWRLLGSSDYRALEGVMRDTFVKTVNCYVEDRLSRIHVPVLLFRGENDEAVTARQMTVLEERIPDAGLVTLEDAGHYGFLDDFDTFLAATETFLDALND